MSQPKAGRDPRNGLGLLVGSAELGSAELPVDSWDGDEDFVSSNKDKRCCKVKM
jgi:hypothetical protein